MDAPEDTAERITRRLEELLQHSTLPPETMLNMLRRAGIDPLSEYERLQREQQKED